MKNHCKSCPNFQEDCERCRPIKPIKVELGGGYYLKCGHLGCEKDIKLEFNYCPYCGQKIDYDI